MIRRVVLASVMLVAVGGTAVGLLRTPDRSDGRSSSGPSGKSLGSVRGISFDGFDTSDRTELDSFRGKPVVVNYWASWCLFCIAEMPDFQKVYESVSDRVEFLGVNIQDDLDEAKRLAEVTKVRYPLASDPDGAAYKRLKGFSMPTTWFIDAEGRVVERFSGPLTADQLAQRIEKHFGA